MPLLIFLLLIILVAQFGFWDTFAAILGSIGIIILLVLTLVALAVVVAAMFMRRLRGR